VVVDIALFRKAIDVRQTECEGYQGDVRIKVVTRSHSKARHNCSAVSLRLTSCWELASCSLCVTERRPLYHDIRLTMEQCYCRVLMSYRRFHSKRFSTLLVSILLFYNAVSRTANAIITMKFCLFIRLFCDTVSTSDNGTSLQCLSYFFIQRQCID
jgi:hypothetical protein